MGEIVQMKMSDGAEIRVYRAPAVGQRKGGLVLLHEIFGLNENTRQMSDEFASHGYEVLAPALFDRESPGYIGSHERLEEAYQLAEVQHPFEMSLDDTLTLVDVLKEKGPVFVTGFCYGGSITYRAAQLRPGDIAAGSSYYGMKVFGFMDEPLTVPMITHFGRFDPYIPMEKVEQLIEKRPEVKTYVYEAGHGFCSGRPDADANAAAESVKRTVELFDQYSAR